MYVQGHKSKFVIDGEHAQWTCDDGFFNIPNNGPIWAYGLNDCGVFVVLPVEILAYLLSLCAPSL